MYPQDEAGPMIDDDDPFGIMAILKPTKKRADYIYGQAHVDDKVVLEGNARIGGFAKVYDGYIKGDARIGGFAKIYGGVWDGSEGIIVSGSWDGPSKPRF
jgi:hypothetical protein